MEQIVSSAPTNPIRRRRPNQQQPTSSTMRSSTVLLSIFSSVLCLQLIGLADGNPSRLKEKPLRCGQHRLAFRPEVISGPAFRAELPFLVDVVITPRNDNPVFCTGTLVSRTRVLTAEDCGLEASKAGSTGEILIGSNLRDVERSVKVETGEQTSISPSISVNSTCGKTRYRLAMLKLATPLNFTLTGSHRTNAICLSGKQESGGEESNDHGFVAYKLNNIYLDKRAPPFQMMEVVCGTDQERFSCVDKYSPNDPLYLQEGAPVFGKDGLLGKWYLIGIHISRCSETHESCLTDTNPAVFIPTDEPAIRDWLHETK